jgi:hypothetical protein
MAGALMLAAALLVPVAAASEAQPEISDVMGDSVSRKDSRDITAAFFHTETNDSFMINMTVAALETYTNPGDLTKAPTIQYEVYFSQGDSNFAVACKVPVHGPLGFTIQFDIRSVSYGNNTTVEASLGTLSGCTYDYNSNNIQFLVAKTHFTNLTAGAHLTRTWAAITSKNFGDTTYTTEDRGPNSGYGKDYIVRGATGAEILKVELSADALSQPCAPNDPAIFKISVYNNGTSQVTVDFFNSTVEKGWTLDLELENMTLLTNSTKILTVTVSCPRNAANRTTATVSLYGKVRASSGNQTATTNTLLLTSTVNYIPPKAAATPLTTQILNFFKKPTILTYVVYALIIVAIVGGAAGAAYSRIKRSRQDEPVPAPPAPLPAK